MSARRPTLVLLVALALAACGPSKEEERIKELKRICEASVGGTVYDLEIAYGGTPISLHVSLVGNQAVYSCGTDISKLQCTSDESRCLLGFWFPPSSDSATCKQGRCYFTCEVRALQQDLKDHQEDHLATICGARWDQYLDPPGPFYYDPDLSQVTFP
jgi:hypothetical protein